jgi:hypothetical protein
LLIIQLKIEKILHDESNDLIDTLYEKESPIQSEQISKQIVRKSPKSKYQIFDEVEFARGREVLGDLIVHGMIASGGTDIDWLIEHKGGFVILEFKGFHNDKINIAKGQMIAYEKLHEKLNQSTKCYLCILLDVMILIFQIQTQQFGFLKWINGKQTPFQKIPQTFMVMTQVNKTNSLFIVNIWMKSAWKN